MADFSQLQWWKPEKIEWHIQSAEEKSANQEFCIQQNNPKIKVK